MTAPVDTLDKWLFKSYYMAIMKYRVYFSPGAMEQYKKLKASHRSAVRDAIDIHLSYQPKRVSKSRIKRLREIEHPQYPAQG